MPVEQFHEFLDDIAAAGVYPRYHQGKATQVGMGAAHDAHAVCHRRGVPELCRGYLNCGIMFADKSDSKPEDKRVKR